MEKKRKRNTEEGGGGGGGRYIHTHAGLTYFHWSAAVNEVDANNKHTRRTTALLFPSRDKKRGGKGEKNDVTPDQSVWAQSGTPCVEVRAAKKTVETDGGRAGAFAFSGKVWMYACVHAQ